MQRDPKIYLKDILKAVEKIDSYVENLGFREFSANEIPSFRGTSNNIFSFFLSLMQTGRLVNG